MGWRFEAAEDFGFDGEFGGVGELVAVGAEELDAVVCPGIVRGGDDDAGGEAVGAGEEGDGGSGDDAGAFDGGATGGEAGGEGGGDPVGGLAGVHSNEDAWRRSLAGECAMARPTAWMVAGSSGGWPATPRMPSVPKSFFIKSFSTSIIGVLQARGSEPFESGWNRLAIRLCLL